MSENDQPTEAELQPSAAEPDAQLGTVEQPTPTEVSSVDAASSPPGIVEVSPPQAALVPQTHVRVGGRAGLRVESYTTQTQNVRVTGMDGSALPSAAASREIYRELLELCDSNGPTEDTVNRIREVLLARIGG